MYRFKNMRLSEVQLISKSDTSEVIICEDLNSVDRTRYSVFATTDHEIIARLHKAYAQFPVSASGKDINYFSDAGKYLVINPYVERRPLSRFFMGAEMALTDIEDICKNYIITCMTSDLPWPVLYLVLKQDQVNVARDGSVFLSYNLDFSELDENITERDCAGLCASDILEMLSQKDDSVRWNLRELLNKKTKRETFSRFAELYHDVDVASRQSKKKGIITRILVWFSDHKDRLFRILLVICIILVLFTLITLLTNAIFGDVPWLRFFIRSFERIGTESLLQ